MKGKHVGTARRAGRYLTAGARRRRPVSAKDRTTVRLVICGVIFVLIVAVKLLFPQAVAELAQSASQLIGRDADFLEAFAAVGRAVSGEEGAEDSLQDAYTAVFNPSEISSQTDAAALPAEEVFSATTEIPAQSETQQQEEEPRQSEQTREQSLSGVYTMPPPPENASLEMRNLGFSYTTPLKGTLSSAFGWREHPTGGGTKFHYGLDLAADSGAEIVAFADGEVFATGESSTLGKYIILVHAGGYKTLYAHCREIVVLSGSVSLGETIALVGETGTATGPHLHFELQDGTMYLNPIYYVSIW